MRIWVDSADFAEIAAWAGDDRISGFTTNPTLIQNASQFIPGYRESNELGMSWAKEAVRLAAGKPISIDGPPIVWDLGPNVIRKVVKYENRERASQRSNLTAVCTVAQVPNDGTVWEDDIISVFAGRIMDTGRDPQPVIRAARATGAQVLWASVREPYNIIQAEAAGCDIITVPPVILTKYFDWLGLPLETVAARTIAQFDRDREGLWTT